MGLDANYCACILCILGFKIGNKRYYPSVEESLNYMLTGRFVRLPEYDTAKAQPTAPALVQVQLL